ncbi:MAG: glycoside hydrolase family 16 protein [Pontiellaceae bacterium]|nr:glycoside hydrolase family 16 protein [Pontiellaceae bacterium]MBN2785995.1 glycoside hydrolase family 16 protein [Pontiellaceae bacterium]
MGDETLEKPETAVITPPVWCDEFDHGSAPDERKWSYDLGAGGWGNRELQTYTADPANVRIEDGRLVITALKEKDGFTSARIKTEGKFSFRYGTLEARIQVPDMGNGLWPALWMLGNSFSNIGWPACGELIAMEMGIGGAIADGVVNRRVTSAAHWQVERRHNTAGATLDHPTDLTDGFHTYRMEWTPTELITSIDDSRIWSLDISGIEQFHKPHFLLLNLAVGGDYAGIHHPADITAPLPAEYRIDHIRVFDNGHTKVII